MVDRRPQTVIPLHLTGVPIRIAHWLRAAGIPAVEVASGTFSNGRLASANSPAPILFDSRTPSSRVDGSQAAASGAHTFDVAELLSASAMASDSMTDSHILLLDDSPPVDALHFQQRCFLERLKRQIERTGGIWARIADFPFPYRSAVWADVETAKLHAPSDHESSATSSESQLALISKCYATGVPTQLPPGTDTADGLRRIREEFPMLWQTTRSEFEGWRRRREQISLRMTVGKGVCSVACDFDARQLAPTLEFWRGEHIASLPLTSPEMQFHISGLVFQKGAPRHPAGYNALSTPAAHGEELSVANAI